MIRAILDTFADSTWADWFATLAELVGAIIIAVAVIVIAYGFAPYTPGQ